MKKIIYSCLLLIILSGCSKKYYLLPNNVKFDLNYLDTIIYKSNQNTFDTLFISEYNYGLVPDLYSDETDVYYEKMEITLSKKQGNIFKIYVGYDWSRNIRCILSIPNGAQIFKKTSDRTISYQTEKRTYFHVYECIVNDSNYSTIYFNFDKGIIAYTKTNEEIFELYKYIKNR